MGNFNILPTEIKLEILTRLPTETVLDCKLVCKPWRNLITHHPSFSRLHLTHLNNSTDSGECSFPVFSEDPEGLWYLQYNEKHDDTPTCSIRRINLAPTFTRSYYGGLGSFNGLVCLYGRPGDAAYCVCNPLTREYVVFPNSRRDCDDPCFLFPKGFGYLPLTDEYKIVEVHRSRREPNFIEVRVYTLGSGHGWRNVGRFGSILPSRVPGVFINGALYWKEDHAAAGHSVEEGRGRLFVFDLTEEKFHKPISVPLLPPDADHVWRNYLIGNLGGVLYHSVGYCSKISHETCFDIWLLKKNNVNPEMKEQLGWSKEFSLPKEKPLAITKSGGVLFVDLSSLCIYYPNTSTIKMLIDGITVDIFPHKNTFVSLKEIGEEDIQIFESAEIEEIRSRDLTT